MPRASICGDDSGSRPTAVLTDMMANYSHAVCADVYAKVALDRARCVCEVCFRLEGDANANLVKISNRGVNHDEGLRVTVLYRAAFGSV